MLDTRGHEMAKAKGGSRESKATTRHNNWKAGVAAYEGRHQNGGDDRPAAVVKKE